MSHVRHRDHPSALTSWDRSIAWRQNKDNDVTFSLRQCCSFAAPLKLMKWLTYCAALVHFLHVYDVGKTDQTVPTFYFSKKWEREEMKGSSDIKRFLLIDDWMFERATIGFRAKQNTVCVYRQLWAKWTMDNLTITP